MIALLLVALLGGPSVGQPLPWFAGWSAEDQVINRDAVLAPPAEGRVIVLFATWCAPCEAGLKALVKARAGGALPGVDLTLIACGEPPETVKPWLAVRGLGEARVVYDRFGAIAADLGIEQTSGSARSLALPRVIAADRAGIVRGVFDGAQAHDPKRIAAALKPAAAP